MKRSVIISGNIFLHLNCRMSLMSLVPTPATLRHWLRSMQFRKVQMKHAWLNVRGASQLMDYVEDILTQCVPCIFTWFDVHSTKKKPNAVLYRCYMFGRHPQGAIHQDLKLTTIQYIKYYTFKSTILITVCETHMVYISCKNTVM
jgi:hypothetical protein